MSIGSVRWSIEWNGNIYLSHEAITRIGIIRYATWVQNEAILNNRWNWTGRNEHHLMNQRLNIQDFVVQISCTHPANEIPHVHCDWSGLMKGFLIHCGKSNRYFRAVTLSHHFPVLCHLSTFGVARTRGDKVWLFLCKCHQSPADLKIDKTKKLWTHIIESLWTVFLLSMYQSLFPYPDDCSFWFGAKKTNFS